MWPMFIFENWLKEGVMIGRIGCFAAMLALSAGAASAQSSEFWGSVGDWNVSIDTTIENGCFALADWDSGEIMRIGRNPQRNNMYILIGNQKWASLEAGVTYEIKFQIDRRPRWDVKASGFQFNSGETVYLYVPFDQLDFIREFQRGNSFKITYDGSQIANLSLSGSRRAWEEVERCQREVNRRDPGDPFATGGGSTRPSGGSSEGRKSADPFASN